MTMHDQPVPKTHGFAAAGVRFNFHSSRTGRCMQQPMMMISMTLGGGYAQAATW
jgi:hypothetical protein